MHVSRSSKHTEVFHKGQKIPLALTRINWLSSSRKSNECPPRPSLRRFRDKSIVYAQSRTSRGCRATSVRRRTKQRVPSDGSSVTYKLDTRTGAAAIASQWEALSDCSTTRMWAPQSEAQTLFRASQTSTISASRTPLYNACSLPWSSGALGRRTSRRRSSHPLGSRTSS